MQQLKVNIITSCTGEKLHAPEGKLKPEDFQTIHDAEDFRAKEEFLNEFRTSAENIYTGQQHVQQRQLIQNLMKYMNIFSEKYQQKLYMLFRGMCCRTQQRQKLGIQKIQLI